MKAYAHLFCATEQYAVAPHVLFVIDNSLNANEHR